MNSCNAMLILSLMKLPAPSPDCILCGFFKMWFPGADYDDCQLWGVCDQLCEDRIGTHRCSCKEGYVLEQHRYCRANTSCESLRTWTWMLNIQRSMKRKGVCIYACSYTCWKSHWGLKYHIKWIKLENSFEVQGHDILLSIPYLKTWHSLFHGIC